MLTFFLFFFFTQIVIIVFTDYIREGGLCLFLTWSQSISFYSVCKSETLRLYSMTCYVLYGMYSFVDVHHPFCMICYELQFVLYVTNLHNVQYVMNLQTYDMLRILARWLTLARLGVTRNPNQLRMCAIVHKCILSPNTKSDHDTQVKISKQTLNQLH